MKRRNSTILFCILFCLFILAFDFFKFDIMIRVKGLGAAIITGFLLLIPYILFGIIAFWSLIYLFNQRKAKKWQAFTPVGIILATAFLLSVFPYTNTYLKLNYALNEKKRQETAQLVNNREMQHYQIGTDKYIAPYRFTSYSGILYTDVHDGETKIMFYAYRGFKKDVVVVYTSDDSGITDRDFCEGNVECNYGSIKKLNANWYSATIEGYKMRPD